MFPPLVQAQLDEFRDYWNSRLVTKQEKKIMPSAHIPKLLMKSPEQAGGIDCLVPVPPGALQALRDFIEETGGSREELLRWPGVDEDFEAQANAAYVAIGSPKLTLESSWHVFRDMIPLLEQLYM